ncbi:hypothetical protein OBBRIDRAFT_840369 [Obba rivulosa]|uniref:Uncharacterized protein n=1 Tax=Obba rivulosa TaxID=1052685 RepID=A0A8E2DIB7_9APHY|nr:hypothetical protein OBBRIDRAFT_840369 [Obba rivulosa]
MTYEKGLDTALREFEALVKDNGGISIEKPFQFQQQPQRDRPHICYVSQEHSYNLGRYT